MVDEDSGATLIDTLANDFDPDGAPVTMVAVGIPNMGGTAILSGTNGVDYTPAPDFFGTELITYTVTDGAPFGFATATISVTVEPINDAPLAVDDTKETVEDTPVTIDVTDNDTDHADPAATDGGQILQIANLGGTSAGGMLQLTGSPPTQIIYTPLQDYVGIDVFTYELSDSNGGADTGTVTVTVTAVNDTPLAMDDAYTLTHPIFQEPLLPLGNDVDVEGDTLAIINLGTTSSGGIIVMDSSNPTTQVNYTPQPTFLGTETFSYTVSDGNTTAVATVSINLVEPNEAPSATNDTATVDEDSTDNSIDVSDNDSDPDEDSLTVTGVGTPDMGGSVTANGGMVDYTPAPGFVGTEIFTYTVSDGKGGNDSATVTVTVANVNDDPTAADDAYTVAENSANTLLDVTTNDDIAPDTGETLTVDSVGAPDNGGTAAPSGSDIDYTPAADFSGVETFTYIVADGNGGTASATVVVTVTAAANNAPVAVDDSASVVQDTVLSGATVLNNDSDEDGDTLTVNTTPVTDVSNGTLVLNVDGTYMYTPTAEYSGADSFEYEVNDGNDGTATAVVNITVTAKDAPANNAPVAEDDAISSFVGVTLEGTSVLENDSDADEDTLQVNTVPVTNVVNGLLVLNADGTYEYTPNAGFDGTDSFVYQVEDGKGGTATATVTITVVQTGDGNTPPVSATNGVVESTVAADGALSGSLLDGISDPDGDPLSVDTTPITNVENGQLIINADGTYSYTPNPNFVGRDSFTYRVEDSQGGALIVTVDINVTGSSSGEIKVFLPAVLK